MVLVQRQQVISMRRQLSCLGTLGQQEQEQDGQIGGSSPTKQLHSSNNNCRNSSFTSCVMGDSKDSYSISTVSSHQSSYSSSLANSRKGSIPKPTLLPLSFGSNNNNNNNSSSSNHHQRGEVVKSPHYVLVLVCACTALSWFRAIQYRTASFDILSTMDIELESL